MQHMVMKHGNQYESFYDHMTYPVDLYRTCCSVGDCGSNGKYLNADPMLVQVDWLMVNFLFKLLLKNINQYCLQIG